MKKVGMICTVVLFLTSVSLKAQYSVGDTWYNNPLGFDPINLHTSMGFIIPAVAVGACLLLTSNDTSLTNRISIYNQSGFSFGYKYPQTFLAKNSTGINYHLRKWMSVGVEVSVCFPRDEFNSTVGISIRPFARFYPVNKETWRIYFESGAGLVYFFDYFPKPTGMDGHLGTRLNGIPIYGIGSEINFTESTSIVFGVRHIHVSNGNTSGVERNPSHDSNGFFIGASYRP